MNDSSPTVSERFAHFAAGVRLKDVPDPVVERARLHILDGIGCALAATRFPFARAALEGLTSLGEAGDHPVIGFTARLAARDAAIMNGILVHGLDYDDTHPAGVIHGTASALPTVLAQGRRAGAGGDDLLRAYLIAIECGARIGAAAKGAFHPVGFHPTSLVGVFACALAAGVLAGLDRRQLVAAQGIALSQASGTFEFLDQGAWTKRLHPGWAAAAAIAAAALAGAGFVAPTRAYEGRFGLYRCFLGPEAAIDWPLLAAGLGEEWEMLRVALKPYPSCHFNHAFADAALALRAAHGLAPDDIARVTALIGAGSVSTVCEPAAQKQAPANDYEARFSLPYTVAAALVRGRFTLAELEPDCLNDATIRALCRKVDYAVDPASEYPRYFSGELAIETRDGRLVRHRERINRGADERPLAPEEVVAKFMANAEPVVGPARARAICDATLALGRSGEDAAAFAERLALGQRQS